MSGSPRNETNETTQRTVTTSGPLGPWRLTAAVAAVAVTTGPQLARATSTGHDLDQVLGRSIAVAAVTWVSLTVINSILARGETAPDRSKQPADTVDGSSTDPSGHQLNRPNTADY